MLFLWFYHACRRGSPRFMMVADHVNYLTFEDPGAVHTVRRALKLAEAGDLYGAAETAGVDVSHAATVSQGLRRGMRFSIGAEVDNDPRARPDAQNIVDAMRPDGMLRAVHFLTIDHPEKGADWQWPLENPEFRDLFETVGTERVWELYVAKLVDDVEKLPGHIVAHFYSPAVFGHWPAQRRLEEHEDRLLEACAARGMAVEVNTRYLYRDHPEELKTAYRSALLRLMKKAKARGVGIAIGSGAHSPKDQGNGFDQVLRMLDEAGINEIVFPVAGRLARVALRATKEHLQAVKSQEPVQLPGSSISGFGRAELGLPERDEAEEARERAGSKTGHDKGPRKRASGPARETKKPVKSAASVVREPKAAKAKPPAKAPKGEEKPAAAKAKPAAARAAVKAAAPAKPVPVRAKTAAAPKAAAKKSAASAKPAKAAAVPKRAPAKKAPAPKKKTAVPKKAVKKAPPAKKAAAKKPAAKKPAGKKTAAPKHKPSTSKRASTKKTSAKRR